MGRIKRVHPILQMEMTECGAASLAMVLEYYGKTVSLEELRRDCGVSRNGVNAKNIVLAARYHGLEVTPVRSEIDGLKTAKLPAIIHWNMDHFVVLCGFKKKGAVIADPEYGIRTVPNDEFSRSFTGIALIMKPSESFEKNGGKRRRNDYILTLLRPFLPSMITFLILELCMLFANLVMFFLNSVFIDNIIIEQNTKHLAYVMSTLAVSGLICIIAAWLRESLVWRVGRFLGANINSGFIRKLMKLPVDFFLNRSPGDLTSRQDANLTIGDAISASVFPVPSYVMQIILYLIILAASNTAIASAAALFGVLNVTLLIIVSVLYTRSAPLLSRDAGNLQSDVSRAIDLIDTIKSFGAEESMFFRLVSRGTASLNTRVRINRIKIISDSIFILLNMLCSGTILIVGAHQIIAGNITTGMLISMQSIAAAMIVPMDNAVRAGAASESIRGDIARTEDVMLYQDDDKFLPAGKTQTGSMTGDIALKNVSFGYNRIDPLIVSGISINIKQGSTVAITGASGSGKSTAAKLIAGILAPTDGEITYNGLTTREIDRDCFYSEISSVSQQVRLFTGTIADNITMWDDEISYEDTVRAANAACIHEHILRRPRGYRGRVEENGKNFSGGQRQRIEIARAIAKKPSVLILDEATSALDTETEATVMENIKAMGITLIVVAHRLSAVRDCDEIIVMDKGTICERGTHDELMEKRGEYYKLIRSNS